MSKPMSKLYKVTKASMTGNVETYLMAESIVDAANVKSGDVGVEIVKVEKLDYALTASAISMYIQGRKDED